MNNYKIVYNSIAEKNLNEIFEYIFTNLLEPQIAKNTLDTLEKSILSLQNFPYRCPLRKNGIYSGLGYRQLLINNFIVIYKIDEAKKLVIIVTVKYSKSSF